MAAQRDTIQFVLDGQLVQAKAPPTTTVLEYLRGPLGRTGTKEGCAEGDCGACTVVLGTLSRDGGHMEYRAVNSCVRFLPTIDGQALITVESLQADDGTLHPVQQALVDNHASQCGFCTPGFVMSLFALYLQGDAVSQEAVIDAIRGNLCRCTGYRPIIAAGCAMGSYPPPARWNRADAQAPARLEALRSLRDSAPLVFEGFRAPRDVDELAQALRAAPNSLLLAGGTDIGLWVTKQLRELPAIIYLGSVAELRCVHDRDEGLQIGAAVPLTDAWEAILALYPRLEELVRRFASPPVCNSGTLCGNIANGSPVGDSMPLLIALGAQLQLRRGTVTRCLALEDFYLGYQRKDLQPGEFITSVTVPRPRERQRVASYKLSKRFDQDIAAVCAAFVIELEADRVVAARIAFGGMAAIPARAHAAEAALMGKQWNVQTVEAAGAALAVDFQPLTDLRASSAYRLQSAASLLKRFYLEERSAPPALRITDASLSRE